MRGGRFHWTERLRANDAECLAIRDDFLWALSSLTHEGLLSGTRHHYFDGYLLNEVDSLIPAGGLKVDLAERIAVWSAPLSERLQITMVGESANPARTLEVLTRMTPAAKGSTAFYVPIDALT